MRKQDNVIDLIFWDNNITIELHLMNIKEQNKCKKSVLKTDRVLGSKS